MGSRAPENMGAAEAARVLERALGRDFRGNLTVADAASAGGLALRDAQAGLTWLVGEYRGHLRATDKGELVHRFPHGFRKPWETRSRLEELAGKVARGALGLMRFVVRAWISIVLVGYAVLFLAVLVALLFSGDRDKGGSRAFDLGHVVFRVVFEALFWTFHPWSPFAVGYAGGPGQVEQRAKKEKKPPFYERVNRYFFGPDRPEPDPRATERAVLAEIRAQKGRVGLADVMRVTGLPRDEADPMMARLMLDYDGTVEVSEEGGIVYRFQDLRRTTREGPPGPRPRPVWAEKKVLPPLTGNDGGSNVLITMLNLFNVVMSLVVLGSDLTLSRVWWLVQGLPLEELPPDGPAIALGLVPLLFSLALFLLPLGRALVRRLRAGSVARENGRRAVLKTILTDLRSAPITEEKLRVAWREAAGAEPSAKELTREVVSLGGDLEVQDDGRTLWRFPDFEAEAKALDEEREAAAEEEAKVGQVVFASDA